MPLIEDFDSEHTAKKLKLSKSDCVLIYIPFLFQGMTVGLKELTANQNAKILNSDCVFESPGIRKLD
ncbi:hypothetical protein SUGI_0108200 [Cryptomeria japonica]|nr:hypothetical protein SUGI_0108200 [Cryptomeria japonica]